MRAVCDLSQHTPLAQPRQRHFQQFPRLDPQLRTHPRGLDEHPTLMHQMLPEARQRAPFSALCSQTKVTDCAKSGSSSEGIATSRWFERLEPAAIGQV